MKWLGQHIVDLIARFRSDVYLEDLTTDTSTNILVVDSDGKICKNAAAGDDMTFDVAADGGADESIVDGETLTIAGGSAITTANTTNTVTINHDDTSTQASSNNSGNTVIQDVLLDTYGHVTTLRTAEINSVEDAVTAESAASAEVATQVTVTHADVSDTTCFIPFVTAGLDGTYGLKTEDGLAYDATHNNITTTTFTGALTGNASGTAAAVTAVTQAAITTCANLVSIGTITTGTWNGTKITDVYTNSSGKRFGSTIKLLPSDFMGNEDSLGTAIHWRDASNGGVVPGDATTEMYAFVTIPEGMTATGVTIYSNSSSRDVFVYLGNVDANWSNTSLGDAKLNSTITIDVDATATNYLIIKVDVSHLTNQRISGGLITIASQ